MKFDTRFALTAVAESLLVMALAACGGGGGSSDAAQAGTPADVAAAEDEETDKVLVDAFEAIEKAEPAERVLAASKDPIAPTIRITGGALSTDKVAHSLTGAAGDNVGVRHIVWHNKRLARIGYAQLSGTGTSATWSVSRVPLAVGDNLIYIAAFDAAGNKTRIQTTLTLKSGAVTGKPTPAPAPAPTPAPSPAPAPAPTPAPAPAPTPAPAPAPSAATALSPACKALYASTATSTLNSLLAVVTVPVMGKPAKGVAMMEPSFKTCLVRAADHKADGVPGFARNDYSRRQAFNANNTRQLIYSNDGWWHLYDANTHAHLKKLSGPAGDAEPQWDATNPDLLVYLPTQGMGMKVHELNVSTGATRVIGDLGARLKARWPTAMAAWTGSEGSPSADGRYHCFMVDGTGWNSVGVVTWDRQTDTITGMYNTNGERPDHVSMSPTGNYCVVSSTGALGTTSFSRDFSKKTQLLKASQHSDLALDANGDDNYVAIDYGSNEGDVFMHNLRTNVRTKLFSTYLSGTATALHVSGKAFRKPGWVVISTYAEGGGSQKWLHKKIMAVQLAASPKIYNLAFHRSGANGYWTTPVASVNRDFTRVTFNSNWGNGSDTDVDDYTVEIPATLLK